MHNYKPGDVIKYAVKYNYNNKISLYENYKVNSVITSHSGTVYRLEDPDGTISSLVDAEATANDMLDLFLYIRVEYGLFKDTFKLKRS